MKYCPKCRAEFQDWVEKCLDCNVDLVDTLPLPDNEIETDLEPVTRSDNLKVVAIYRTLVDANLVKSILEDEGIGEVIVSEAEPNVNWILPQSTLGGVFLLVRESDAGEAVEIIKSITDIVPIVCADIYTGEDEDDEYYDEDEEDTRDDANTHN